MYQGYVKLHRKILDNEALMQDHALLTVFIWCLAKANWQDTARNGDTLKRGELRMRYANVSETLKISMTTLKRKIARLEDLGCVEAKSDHQGTTITICNYGVYQDACGEGGPQMDRKRTENGQLILIDEEIKELKEPRPAEKNILPLHQTNSTEGDVDCSAEAIVTEFLRLYCGAMIPPARGLLVAFMAEKIRITRDADSVMHAVRDESRDRTQTLLTFGDWFRARGQTSKTDENRVLEGLLQRREGGSA
jgi:hypothetical protein